MTTDAGAQLRILVVEDSASDAALILSHLEDAGADLSPTLVATAEAAVQVLDAERVDCAVVDLELPDSSGMQTIRRLLDVARDLPIVVVTGRDGQLVGAESLANGAHEFLSKSELTSLRLGQAIGYAMQRARMTQRAVTGPAEDLELALHELGDAVAAARAALATGIANGSPEHPAADPTERLRRIAQLVARCQQAAAGGAPFTGGTEMDEVMVTVAILLEGHLARTGVSLEVGLLPTLQADAASLREVMLHLVRSAAADVGEGGRVWVRGWSDGGLGTVEVGRTRRDDGAVDDRDRDEDPGAVRAAGRVGARVAGVGLGRTTSLDFCAGMVIAFGGSLWQAMDAQDQPTVRFRLPAA